MIIFGKIISFFAQFILKTKWKCLRYNLELRYKDYSITLKKHLPQIIIITLIEAEDHRFFKHSGIDLIAIIRAIWKVMIYRKVEGGSTIEQQLVRTITGRYERKIGRKVIEILLASLVNKAIPKNDIPGLYLSIAYFGWKMNGVEQTCRHLGINLRKITVQQSSSLISRIKYPEPQFPTHKRSMQIANRSHYLNNLILDKYGVQFYNDMEYKNNATLLSIKAGPPIN